MTKQNPYGRFAVFSYDKYQSQFPNAVSAGTYDKLDDAKAHADSVTYKMVVVDMQSESSGFVYINEQPPTSSPWGIVEHSHRFAEGIWFVSTASHGGYWLSDQRCKELHEVGVFKAFGPWLEEDCLACLVYLRWPGYSTDEQIADAIRMASIVSSWEGCERWKPIVEWLKTTMLHERAQAHAEAVKQMWQRGSMASNKGYGWTVWFHRGGEQREVIMDYPTKRYYTDEELAALAKPSAPTPPKRSPFPDWCFIGGGDDFQPSDADPGL